MLANRIDAAAGPNRRGDASALSVLLIAGTDLASGRERASALEGLAGGSLRVLVTADFDGTSFSRFDAVIVAQGVEIKPQVEADLVAYVQKGGSLLCLGTCVDLWSEVPSLREAFGIVPGHRTPLTELVVRVPATSNHPITRRLNAGSALEYAANPHPDITFMLVDSVVLSAAKETVQDETVLLVSWRGERLPAASARAVGRGRLFTSSLGAASGTWQNPAFQQLIYQAIRYGAGHSEAPPLGVAMLGYGAIGREHALAASRVEGLNLRAICDRNPDRLSAARSSFEGVTTTTDAAAIARDPAIDLVIVSTPPNMHATHAMDLLAAGKHVVLEKPFCLTTQEADAMIARAQEVDRVLTVYQCRRWDPDYLAIKSLVDSGAIGEVFHLETFIGAYSHPCDYWHSHQPVSGGVFYDWGSHYLDWILNLLPGAVKTVTGFEHKRVWHDVSNADQARISLRFEGGREADFIHSDIAAALKPKWYILGSKGAIVADWRTETVKSRLWSGDLVESRLAPSEALPTVTAYLRGDGGAIDTQQLTLPAAPAFPFHRNLANHILAGEALAVTPAQARRTVAVLEAATLSARDGGRPLHLEI